MAAANNNQMTPEELQRLEKMRLGESLLLYRTDEDESRVKATVAPAVTGNLDNVTERLDALNLEAGQRALTEAFAVALNTNKQRGRTLTLAEVPDPLATGNLDYFQVDMTKDTVEGMIGTQQVPNAAAQRRFYTFPFKNEAMRSQCLKDLVLFAYMKALVPVTVEEARAAYRDARDDDTAVQYLKNKRAQQQRALITFMGSMNTAKTMNEASQHISASIQNDIMRTTTLTNLSGKTLIAAPVLGNMSSCEPETLRNINTIISNTPFGSPHNNKPLSHFLTTVAGVINGQYNQKGAYQILLNVLSGAPHQLIAQNEQQQIPFVNAWMDLQITYNTYGQTTEGVMAQIKNCLRTRPTDVTNSIGYLRQLFYKKNQFKDPSERDLITNSETKDCIFSLLQIWYPTYLPGIRSRFEELSTHARTHGYKILPAPQLLTILAAEYIKQGEALPQKAAEVNALQVTDRTTDFSENALINDTYTYLSKQTEAQPEINAFHQNQQGNPGGNRIPYVIPEHLRDKCLKCTSSQHLARNCPKYPNEPIASTCCVYCNGKHSSKCKNIGVNEMQVSPGQEDARNDSYGAQASGQYTPQYGYQGNHQ